MRIYQLPFDEETLWSYLQLGELDKAIEIVDWYYAPSNPEGFDDPNGVTKAEYLNPSENLHVQLGSLIEIKKSRKSNGVLLFLIGIIFLFFGFLSFKVGNLYPMLIPGILLPIAIVPIYNLFDKKGQITLTNEHVEFRKSKKLPINWNNILAIYHYHRDGGGIRYPGFQSADFIKIYRKNAVKAESFYINHLEYKPTDIVYLINEYKKKYGR